MSTTADITNTDITPISFSHIMYWHLSAYWVATMSFLALDYYWYSNGISKYKFSISADGRPFAPTRMIYKAIVVAICNQIVATPFIYYITEYCIDQSWQLSLYDIYYSPLYFLLYVLLADQWFYWTHRTLHMNRFLYKHIHSIHHQWVFPMAIRAIYAHPVEHVIGNVGSLMIGPLCFPINGALLCLWVTSATLNSVLAHSGTKIYMLTDEAHDMHHRVLLCNFGVMGLCDRLFGTHRTARIRPEEVYNQSHT